MTIHNQQGFSMVSVLLAWLICSTSVLIIYRLSRQSMHFVMAAHQHSVAVVLLLSAKNSHLSQSKIKLYTKWQQQAQHLLPQGNARVECRDRLCEAEVHWHLHQPYSKKVAYAL